MAHFSALNLLLNLNYKLILTGMLWLCVVVTIVAFIHEYGHYIVAKKCGVKVEVFAIGMGPEIFGFNDKSGVRWKICIFPIGGYVKMFGQSDIPKDLSDYEKSEKYSFNNKSKPQKIAIAIAGPVANIILAFIIYAAAYSIFGKQFTRINNTKSNISNNIVYGNHIKMGLKEAIVVAGFDAYNITIKTGEGILKLISGQADIKTLSGPIRIGRFSHLAAQMGFEAFLHFLAIISIGIGIMNLVPIPVLDGGMIALNLIEIIIRRDIPIKIQQLIYQAGFIIVILLMLTGIVNDYKFLSK